jgi:hypothetical protein
MNTKDINKVSESCIIANPIYDTVLSQLIENEQIAKYFISTVIGEQVISIKIYPRKVSYEEIVAQTEEKEGKVEQTPHKVGYSVYHIDCMVTVITKLNNEVKKHIEILKSCDREDLLLYREYLDQQYYKNTIFRLNFIPVTTIYIILGFKLSDINKPYIFSKITYTDMITGQIIDENTPLIELFMHNAAIIQVERIADKYTTKIDKLLSIFEQAHFVNDDSKVSKQYIHQPDNDDIQLIISVLQEIIADPEKCEKIEKDEKTLSGFLTC